MTTEVPSTTDQPEHFELTRGTETHTDESVTESSTAARGNTVAFSALWLVLLVANIAPIWIVHNFPAQNGPWFLATVHIFKELDNPDFGYSEYYGRSWRPIPHMLYHVLMLDLDLGLPLQIAEKVALSMVVTLLPLSVLYFLSVVASQRRMLALLSFLMVYSYPFLRGYNNYTLSVPMFFFTFGYWLKTRDSASALKYVVLAILSVLLYLSHLIAFLLLTCTIGWYQLRRRVGWWSATRSALAATGCGWPLVIAYLTLNTHSSEWIEQTDTIWQPLHWTVQYFFERYFMSVSVPAFLVAVAAWTWVPALLIVAASSDSRGFWRCCRSVALSPLGSLVLVLVASFLLLPDHIIGWHKFNQRLIPFVLVFSLGAVATVLRDGQYRRLRRAFLATVAIAGLAVPAFVGRELVKMDLLLQRYTAAVDELPLRSRLLPLHYDNPAFGFIRPLTRAHEYYLIERGGGNGNGIASMNTLSMVWYRHYPERDTFPQYRDEMSDEEFEEMLASYDCVLVWGAGEQPVEGRLKESGLRALHKDDLLRLYGRM